jgi:hypothetical protein
MAVNTAGQGARPSPAYANAQHPSESRNRSPQSGEDIGGPSHFLAGKGIPTSGGTAKPGAKYSTDRTNDQGGKKLYLGKAFENAQRVNFIKTKGNSVGRMELQTNHESDTISRAAKTRITRGNKVDTQVKGHDEFAGHPFRTGRTHPFGPVKSERRTQARSHAEHESARKF